MTNFRHRSDLDALPAYRQGKAPTPDRPRHKLSSNENPYPPLPSVIDRLGASLAHLNRYPDNSAAALVDRLAALHGVDRTEIILGAGSVEIASQLIRATAGAGDEVVFAWRSFEAYPQLVIAAGATPVQVPLLPDLTHDLDALAAAIGARTRLVILCTPNNPTGTVIRSCDFDRFMAKVPDDVLVVVDEAYVQFDRDPDSVDGPAAFRAHSNVVVAHTFSKAYGLAGMRVGYAVAPADVVDTLRKVQLPFGVTDVAQAAVMASLDAGAELAERVDTVVAERDRVEAALASQGWRLAPSQANFVWLPLGGSTAAAAGVLDRHGIIARTFPGDGIRVSLGTPEADDAVISAAAEILADLPVPRAYVTEAAHA